MADLTPLLYEAEVELVVASVVLHCVEREDDRPLIRQRLCDIFLGDLPVDDAPFSQFVGMEELHVLVGATKIALKRMY